MVSEQGEDGFGNFSASNPMFDRGRKIQIVLSYKTTDEQKDGIISACTRELEQKYHYDVYYERYCYY